jgi:hypothetical protein
MLRATTVLPAVGIAIEVVLCVTLAITLPRPHPAQVAGTARCASGAAVQGVWIEGRSGGSDFADLTPDDRRSAEVTYRHTLPNGGRYQVRVGCGGTPGHWSRTIVSDYLNPSVYRLLCQDLPGPANDGKCVMTRQ